MDIGTIKNKPPMVSAIPFAAITSLPNLPSMMPAPLNILSSIKFPKPTGMPPFSISFRIRKLGRSNLENNFVGSNSCLILR